MKKEAGKMKIGVLSLQGGFAEHMRQIESLGHEAIAIRNQCDLEDLSGIILPGGESTTIAKLLKVTGLMEPLKNKIKNGLPTFGTCAGMILLAKDIDGELSHLALMNIKIKRNAFGRQSASFRTFSTIKYIDKSIELVFIRAPYVEEVMGDVEILGKVEDKIVAVREGNIIATAFHPELTEDLSFMKYFIKLCTSFK